ncbi:WD40-repeat-containing domain protein [Spinellus fusiger]|nr:WD40-repeat-containing domain protein [Spinellus fusiger]
MTHSSPTPWSRPTPVPVHSEDRRPSQKKIYTYNAPWHVYALDWCNVPTEKGGFQLAVGSFIEDQINKFQIIGRTDLFSEDDQDTLKESEGKDFFPLAEADSQYPVTKVMWEPWKGNTSRTPDILVTSSDYLRLWHLKENPAYEQVAGNTVSGKKTTVQTQKRLYRKHRFTSYTEFDAPITSFDWNEVDPNLLITSSIDTTCTLWDVETGQAKSQLVAHEKDVYDVAFKHGTTDVFVTVGADGSLRLFDTRALHQSTILYKTPCAVSSSQKGSLGSPCEVTQPLLRLQFNRVQQDLLATLRMDSNAVQVMDIRYPLVPISELTRRQAGSVNCLNWAPRDAKHMCTGGDDSQVLVWDTQPILSYDDSTLQSRTIMDPVLAYSAASEIHAVSWSKSMPMWISVGFGRTIQALLV